MFFMGVDVYCAPLGYHAKYERSKDGPFLAY